MFKRFGIFACVSLLSGIAFGIDDPMSFTVRSPDRVTEFMAPRDTSYRTLVGLSKHGADYEVAKKCLKNSVQIQNDFFAYYLPVLYSPSNLATKTKAIQSLAVIALLCDHRTKESFDHIIKFITTDCLRNYPCVQSNVISYAAIFEFIGSIGRFCKDDGVANSCRWLLLNMYTLPECGRQIAYYVKRIGERDAVHALSSASLLIKFAAYSNDRTFHREAIKSALYLAVSYPEIESEIAAMLCGEVHRHSSGIASYMIKIIGGVLIEHFNGEMSGSEQSLVGLVLRIFKNIYKETSDEHVREVIRRVRNDINTNCFFGCA